MRPRRPATFFDQGVQHERTALAWERTAISMIASGLLLARYAAHTAHWTIASIGVLETMAGGGLLIWAGMRYDDLHGPLRAGEPIVHPRSARVVGMLTMLFTGTALTLALLIALVD